MTYNGWTNYETWLVALWIDNEEGSQRYWAERAQEVYDEERDDDSATYTLASALEEEVKDGAPEVNGLYNDLLGAALSEVNWREIAEHYVADVDKTEPEEEPAL